MVKLSYDHCSKCGFYQHFREGEPVVTVSDGLTMLIVGPGKCWLCGTLYSKEVGL
jgi:hypothetical protein